MEGGRDILLFCLVTNACVSRQFLRYGHKVCHLIHFLRPVLLPLGNVSLVVRYNQYVFATCAYRIVVNWKICNCKLPLGWVVCAYNVVMICNVSFIDLLSNDFQLWL